MWLALTSGNWLFTRCFLVSKYMYMWFALTGELIVHSMLPRVYMYRSASMTLSSHQQWVPTVVIYIRPVFSWNCAGFAFVVLEYVTTKPEIAPAPETPQAWPSEPLNCEYEECSIWTVALVDDNHFCASQSTMWSGWSGKPFAPPERLACSYRCRWFEVKPISKIWAKVLIAHVLAKVGRINYLEWAKVCMQNSGDTKQEPKLWSWPKKLVGLILVTNQTYTLSKPLNEVATSICIFFLLDKTKVFYFRCRAWCTFCPTRTRWICSGRFSIFWQWLRRHTIDHLLLATCRSVACFLTVAWLVFFPNLALQVDLFTSHHIFCGMPSAS
jgi:hypothetical protein